MHQLLPLRFKIRTNSTQDWSKYHFRHLESYIRERERWAIAPTGTTLNSLRQDFYNLAAVYITGNYGEFSWTSAASTPEDQPPTLAHQVLKGLPRFLALVLPLICLALFLWKREQLGFMGINPNIVALIFIAWFFMTVDVLLKLGIVSGVINLAKEIKGLGP
jgi:hypothetical protein